jgi:hypothetical protein
MANNRFYIRCDFHDVQYMFAKDWGDNVALYVDKTDFPDRTQSFEEWLTEHRFCKMTLSTEFDTIGKNVGWIKGEPKGLKDDELIAMKDYESYYYIGRYNAACNWIMLSNGNIWKLYNIKYWMRLEEPEIIELNAEE